MYWSAIATLLLLWLFGMIALPKPGSLIHVILVLALVILIIQLLTGRRTVV